MVVTLLRRQGAMYAVCCSYQRQHDLQHVVQHITRYRRLVIPTSHRYSLRFTLI